ncbi:TetR/AcrR family transcriptional regulator [Pseudooceanicola algae]|uniref:Uncharacterized protein n=1 Tax=Pseudooceanicola algae TaxID=1537215 RepID=A0A418SGT2_9RHOB|nr:TetR/AcrR family transcriptional regulator [Pseudooceanicola algae]QPM88859.1 hypothetical protein PSAL_000620 [Pseudooceanicola algae]
MGRLGRPLAMEAEERREKIFAVAEALFCAHGYRAVSMAQIAAAAGMSKRTIYGAFMSKEDLLNGLIASSLVWDDSVESLPADPVDRLRLQVRRVTRRVLSERHINLCRLAISESMDKETLAHSFLEHGILRSRRAVIETLSQVDPARCRVDLPAETMASMLFGAGSAVSLVTALMGGPMPDLDHQVALAEAVVTALFLPA